MIKRRVRHLLGLTLLTGHERQTLNGFWWAAVGKFSAARNISVKDRIALSESLDEFLDAIEWLEELKA